MERCREILGAGLEALPIALTDAQIEQLLAFIKLLAKWNKAYNLTAIRKLEDMVSLHLLDSLAILPHIQGQRVIDIGTGAGLPGIPLAICLPDVQFSLLDSNAKKTRFVQQAILELKLTNTRVHHSRVEDYQPELGFDTVTTRAFASLPVIIDLTRHLLAENAIVLAMKGQNFDAELAQVATQQSMLIPITVPGVEAERYLVRIQSNLQ
ncbi:methyltransferase, SAM-dependent methyltransferase, glucose-inhibited cell-division protein [Crenothrix polyspora]|uniref:Ribosomal RNA small subunit methyltransferase G n=1 Tax=Crenothrix polyspora TaxID=360316 RepID=A0A1R4HCC0_9GAMM|nr:16S rRNA (guanine(527)-N(7))-methyltransferase RsmG [Crenothrix polyspora]SJM93895.1 methyltransferase, SAM-dependent methyltransferase, glucose-inhibited cell-division protein [Crenothrix polyspora]